MYRSRHPLDHMYARSYPSSGSNLLCARIERKPWTCAYSGNNPGGSEIEGLPPEEIRMRIDAAVNAIKNADMLVPYDGRKATIARSIWKLLDRIPLAHRAENLLKPLGADDIKKLWHFAGYKYTETGNNYVPEDFPAKDDEIVYYVGKAAVWPIMQPFCWFRKALWYKGKDIHGRVFTILSSISSRTYPGPLYFKADIGLQLLPGTIDEVSDGSLRYQLATEELNMLRDTLPMNSWPGPKKPKKIFGNKFTDFVRAIGPGVYVGLGWRTGEMEDSRVFGSKTILYILSWNLTHTGRATSVQTAGMSSCSLRCGMDWRLIAWYHSLNQVTQSAFNRVSLAYFMKASNYASSRYLGASKKCDLEMQVTVHTLTGEMLQLNCHEDDTVHSLKNLLVSKAGQRFKHCHLYCKGTIIDDESTTVGQLNLQEGHYLTALLQKKRRLSKAPPAIDQLLDSPERPREILDSLMPGYLSRPNASPGKPRKIMKCALEGTVSSQSLHNSAALLKSARRSCIPLQGDIEATTVYDQLHKDLQEAYQQSLACNEGTRHPHRVPARGPENMEVVGDSIIAGMPLPGLIVDLQKKLSVLVSLHDFLVAQHIQPTLDNVRTISPESGFLGTEDILTIAKLCPNIISLSKPSKFESPKKAAWKQSEGVLAVNVASALNTAAQSEGAGEGPDGPIPHWMHVRTDGAGTVFAQGSLILKVLDPVQSVSIPSEFTFQCTSKVKHRRLLWIFTRDISLRLLKLYKEKFHDRESGSFTTFLSVNQFPPDFVREITVERLTSITSMSNAPAALDGSCMVAVPQQRPANPPRLVLKQVPCVDTTKYGVDTFVEHLRSLSWYKGQIVHVEDIPQRNAKYKTDLMSMLSDSTSKALNLLGIQRVYSHQSEAVKSVLLGQNIIVATSTASGKSLAYTIPILESLAADPLSCAICMFPTKALAQDQLRSITAFMQAAFGSNGPAVHVYDGDTPSHFRPRIRENANVLITNPDMLHMTILPAHRDFERILKSLKYVVVDEAHMANGVFGCHVALVLRRLRRLCALYGSHPTFVLTSATVASPVEHASTLLGMNGDCIHLIDDDGSPHGPKCFLLWNPPLKHERRSSTEINTKGTEAAILYNELDKSSEGPSAQSAALAKIAASAVSQAARHVQGAPSSARRNIQGTLLSCAGGVSIDQQRRSPILEISMLLAEAIQHGMRTIAFCKTRKLSELVSAYVRETLLTTAPELASSVAVYRSGYSPEERREVEKALLTGKLRGVAATNALELGIDIGGLDCTLHLGFPGSISSLWQQAGRAGRRANKSLSVYIAWDGPLDQHFMSHPDHLFCRPIERAMVDPDNIKLLKAHLRCAAAEQPLNPSTDIELFGSNTAAATQELLSSSDISRNPRCPNDGILYYTGREYRPAAAIQLREIADEYYAIVDETTNETLEQVEVSKAFYQVYDGAVYMHQAKTYLCRKVDLQSRVAIVRPADVRYYTKPIDTADVHVLGGNIAYPSVPVTSLVISGKAVVKINWLGFHRIWRGSGQVFDKVDLFLPSYEYRTEATYFRLPAKAKEKVAEAGLCLRSGLHAAGHALLNVLPLFLICNAGDVGSECDNPYDNRRRLERLLLYDKYNGGIGLALAANPIFLQLMEKALELLMSCDCQTDCGCPCCTQHTDCGEYNSLLSKRAAIIVLEVALEAERSLVWK